MIIGIISSIMDICLNSLDKKRVEGCIIDINNIWKGE